MSNENQDLKEQKKILDDQERLHLIFNSIRDRNSEFFEINTNFKTFLILIIVFTMISTIVLLTLGISPLLIMLAIGFALIYTFSYKSNSIVK